MIEYFTALIISYHLHGQPVDIIVWFENERHCSTAMNNRSADVMYDYLYDLYGNEISMGCYPTQKVSKLIKPRIRPNVGS